MSEFKTKHLLDQQHEQTAADARARVMGYYALDFLHSNPAGYENDDDLTEGKNV